MTHTITFTAATAPSNILVVDGAMDEGSFVCTSATLNGEAFTQELLNKLQSSNERCVYEQAAYTVGAESILFGFEAPAEYTPCEFTD